MILVKILFFSNHFFLVMVAGSKMYFQIYNGMQTDIYYFPFHVGLCIRPFLGALCGGSLISNTVIITAAHCIARDPVEKITVYLGSTYLFMGLKMVPRMKIVHEEYNETCLENDIGLLQINYVTYTTSIRNIELPDLLNSDYNYESELVMASGWGVTSKESNIRSRILQYAEMFVMSNVECAREYSPCEVRETNLCAEAPDGASTCVGDSGGPLIHKATGILIGITSFGPESECNYAAGFTRVTEFRQWILDKTGI